MMDEKESSRLCFYYEMFMERAYCTYEVSIPGRYANIMRNLFMAEEQLVHASFESLVYFEQQLNAVKKDMEEALECYMSKANLNEDTIHELKQKKEKVFWLVSMRN